MTQNYGKILIFAKQTQIKLGWVDEKITEKDNKARQAVDLYFLYLCNKRKTDLALADASVLLLRVKSDGCQTVFFQIIAVWTKIRLKPFKEPLTNTLLPLWNEVPCAPRVSNWRSLILLNQLMIIINKNSHKLLGDRTGQNCKLNSTRTHPTAI